MTLTGAPATGWSFTGWSGDCTGAGTGTVTMDRNRAVTATFAYSGVGDLSAFTGEVFADGGPSGTFTSPLVALENNEPPIAVISVPKSVRAGKPVVLTLPPSG